MDRIKVTEWKDTWMVFCIGLLLRSTWEDWGICQYDGTSFLMVEELSRRCLYVLARLTERVPVLLPNPVIGVRVVTCLASTTLIPIGLGVMCRNYTNRRLPSLVTRLHRLSALQGLSMKKRKKWGIWTSKLWYLRLSASTISRYGYTPSLTEDVLTQTLLQLIELPKRFVEESEVGETTYCNPNYRYTIPCSADRTSWPTRTRQSWMHSFRNCKGITTP